MVQTRAETMLAWFCERTAPWSERLPMRKEAAYAAGSTECDFPNSAAELWTRGERSGEAAGSTECDFPNGAAELWTRGERSGVCRGKHGVRLSEWRG